MKDIKLHGTCNGSGALTVGGIGNTDNISAVLGLLYAVQLIDGTLADGVDITITCDNADLSIPILTQANFNSDGMAYPRVLEALNTDGTALATHCLPILAGVPKMVIASGGAGGIGGCILYVLE